VVRTSGKTLHPILQPGTNPKDEVCGTALQALKESNAEVAPHLSFVDLEVEFLCNPRPIERSDREDGGPLVYRIAHKVKLWRPGTSPRVERTTQEGVLPLGI
jgi:alkaline phosphatase D